VSLRAGSTAPTSAADPALLFGPLALALEARALRAAQAPAAGSDDEVRVIFAAAALPASDRTALARLPDARIRAARAGMDELRVAPVAALERAARGREALACLLAAHRAALAAPGPVRLMGVVNVTPDSFSDGGRHLDRERAIEHGRALAAAGAAILDVGGESTRPGAEEVAVAEELERVLPVIRGLRAACDLPISVDTRKSAVAAAALDAGASLVNDVSAGTFDPRMLAVVAERGAAIVLMHMRGSPRDMQRDPSYADVAREVLAHLRERVADCLKAGIPIPRIAVDPGIGFGKRLEDNLNLIRSVPELRSLGLPVALGVSRKSFLQSLGGAARAEERLSDTAAAVAVGAFLGAEILRVHDVRAMLPAARVASALGARG
jgi:dihydropteroate synthase